MYLPIIALSVFFILFCTLVFLSSKTWLWRHVFLLFGVFVMTLLFMVLAAITLQTQKVWRGQYVSLTSQITRADQRMSELRGPQPITTNKDEMSLPQLQAELSRTLLHRGRVWRGARATSVENNVVKLDMTAWNNAGCVRISVDEAQEVPPVEGGEAAAPAAEPHQIATSTLVHAFVNGPATDLADSKQRFLFGEGDLLAQETRQPCTVPVFYAGHFVVTAAEDAAISMQPVYPLDPQQQAALSGNADWTLYETLPGDDHDVFAGLTEEALAELLQAGENVPPEKMQAAIEEYLRDNSDAQVDDPPQRVWVQVKFISDHTIEVDIEADVAVEEDRNYDTRGRAIPADLHQGRPTSFKAGDVISLDSETANRLVAQGVAELVDEPSRYVRWLRNYELIFRYSNDSLSNLNEAISVTNDEIASLTNQITKVRERIAYREQEKQRLQHDLTGFQLDLTAAKGVREQLQQQRTAQLESLSRLFESNTRRGAPPNLP